MERYLIILIGAIFSAVSGYATWLSWKDVRMAFNLIAKLDTKMWDLEKEVEELKNRDQDKILKS